MRIPFRGYAVDSTITGELELAFDRIKDLLDAAETVEVQRATLRSLDDASELCVPLLRLDRDDLLAVEAEEPRGAPARRIMTVRHPGSMQVGPYLIRGDVHDRPGTPLMSGVTARRPMVSVTGATVRFVRAGREETLHVPTLLLHGLRVEWLAPAAGAPLPELASVVPLGAHPR